MPSQGFRYYYEPAFNGGYQIGNKNYSPISINGILALTPDQVKVHWGVQVPGRAEKHCEESAAKQAGAAAGFDHVIIQ